MRECNSKQLNINTFEALWYKILPPAHKTVVNFFFCSPSSTTPWRNFLCELEIFKKNKKLVKLLGYM